MTQRLRAAIERARREVTDDPRHELSCPSLAAGAHAGGMSWMDGFDKNRHREFWYWYLDAAAPRAYASVPDA